MPKLKEEPMNIIHEIVSEVEGDHQVRIFVEEKKGTCIVRAQLFNLSTQSAEKTRKKEYHKPFRTWMLDSQYKRLWRATRNPRWSQYDKAFNNLSGRLHR